MSEWYDEYSLYCLDEAINHFGQAVTEALDNVKGKNQKSVQARKENLLRQWCGLPKQYRGIEGLVDKGTPSQRAGVEAPFRKE